MPSMIAPITVPMIDPFPPDIEVPPMTAAAIASSSYPVQSLGLMQLRRLDYSNALTPAVNPVMM